MNNRKYPLPAMVRYDMAFKELGLSEFEPLSRLDSLAEAINSNGLRAHTKASNFAGLQLQPTKNGYEASFDHMGNVDKLLSLGQTTQIDDTLPDLALLRVMPHKLNGLSVSEVEINGESMYLVDETGMFVISSAIDLTYIYFKLADLENFLPRNTPPYGDPESDLYAPELALALRLHEDLRVKKIASHLTSMEDRIDFLMEKHYKIEGDIGAAVTRLSRVIGNGKKLPYRTAS